MTKQELVALLDVSKIRAWADSKPAGEMLGGYNRYPTPIAEYLYEAAAAKPWAVDVYKDSIEVSHIGERTIFIDTPAPIRELIGRLFERHVVSRETLTKACDAI